MCVTLNAPFSSFKNQSSNKCLRSFRVKFCHKIRGGGEEDVSTVNIDFYVQDCVCGTFDLDNWEGWDMCIISQVSYLYSDFIPFSTVRTGQVHSLLLRAKIVTV